jgi:SHS2 domain-containing protein
MMELPQPFEELDHTADVGVIVRGGHADETLSRLVLAMSHFLSGGGKLDAKYKMSVRVDAADEVSMAIDVLRELLFHFDCEHRIVARCEVTSFDPSAGAAVDVELADYDDELHEEGTELKAVTFHAARFEREGGGWVAQIVFDV